MDVQSQYVLKKPSPQNVLDIFADEWSSAMPLPELKALPGKAYLFQDNRLEWGLEKMGGVEGLNVLELGPLEAGHSYMLQKQGAKSVHAIEANNRAFLKCLCIKEIFGLDRVRFELGDFVEYLETTQERYDLVVASGVLYHMLEPLRLLERISQVSDRIFLWTHYYDREIIAANPNLQHRFLASTSFIHAGRQYEGAEQIYKDAVKWLGFCGGPKLTSRWLTRESLLAAIKSCGFVNIETSFEERHHPHGPAIAICATR